MSTFSHITTDEDRFIDRVIIHHSFDSVEEWAIGLDVLSRLPDASLDGLFGVTAEQARSDRELFDRIISETERAA